MTKRILGYELSCKHSVTINVPKNRMWSLIDMGTNKRYFSIKEVKEYFNRTEQRYAIVRRLKSPSHIITFLEKSDDPNYIPNYRHIRICTVLEEVENGLETWIERELGFIS